MCLRWVWMTMMFLCCLMLLFYSIEFRISLLMVMLWNGVPFHLYLFYFFTFEKSHLQISITFETTTLTTVWHARFHFISFARFKIYSISKSNHVFIRKRTNMEFERFLMHLLFFWMRTDCLSLSLSPHHILSLQLDRNENMGYKIETAFDDAKMQLMHHQHNIHRTL